MSRTFRRKNYVPQDEVSDYIDVAGTSCRVCVLLSGVELKKALNKWHSDSKNMRRPNKAFRKQQEVYARTEAKKQLVLFWKNPEHEVLIGKIPFPFWD